MMRFRFFAASTLVASLLVASSVQAAQVPRIGVVNLQAVIGRSQAGQQANQALQVIVRKLHSQMVDRKQKLSVIRNQLAKTDKKASNYKQLQKSYNDSQSNLQQFVLMSNQDLEARRDELLQPIEKELGKVLNQYAKTHHYDILISKDAAGAVYATGRYDVTDGVIAAMDTDWAHMQQVKNAKKPARGKK